MIRYEATVGNDQISCKTYQIDSFDETVTSSESSNIDLTIGGFPIKKWIQYMCRYIYHIL